jgi:hypothetical protein
MATAAQIAANRANAQRSTGPRTDTGKAAVAQNHLSHGLSSKTFSLLPVEDPSAFESLLTSLTQEHRPETPTETFLVEDMARAQWKLERALRIEAEILTPAENAGTGWSAIAALFRNDCSSEQALLKLNRYEQAARRAWHKALEQLLKLRAAVRSAVERDARTRRNEEQALMYQILNAPVPGRLARSLGSSAAAEPKNCDSNPMPVHLQRELDAHIRRDPLFNPRMDASQMSKELRKWFDRNARPSA